MLLLRSMKFGLMLMVFCAIQPVFSVMGTFREERLNIHQDIQDLLDSCEHGRGLTFIQRRRKDLEKQADKLRELCCKHWPQYKFSLVFGVSPTEEEFENAENLTQVLNTYQNKLKNA